MRITVRLSGLTKIAALAVVIAAIGCGGSSSNGSGLNEGGSGDATTDGNASGASSSGASSGASSGGDGSFDSTVSDDGSGTDGSSSGSSSGDAGASSGASSSGGASSGTSSGSSSGPAPDASPFNPDSGGTCLNLGAGCTQPSDCCSNTCLSGSCGFPMGCVKDTLSCTSNVECCSGLCALDAGGAGTCAPLPTGGCHSDGNSCTQSSDCCSMFCASNGTCEPSSFCQQTNDVCGSGKDCCSGICNIAAGGLFGTCGAPPTANANCTMLDGFVCGGLVTDAGASVCGGTCCSRLCAPFGPTGVLVCQPASGCHVVGDICRTDSDCCGDHTGQCAIATGAVLGICQNPGYQNDAGHACIPSGDVCTLGSQISCNSSCDCCSGNCNKYDTCRFDTVGVPRCTLGTSCSGPGQACTSSADCCAPDGGTALPCVPNPGDAGPPFICYQGGACVQACGGCTVNADCCAGETCVVPIGSTGGICGPCVQPPDGGFPEGGSSSGGSSSGGSSSGGSSSGGSSSGGSSSGGTTCALYGQLCTVNSDCCNGIPCTAGRCVTP